MLLLVSTDEARFSPFSPSKWNFFPPLSFLGHVDVVLLIIAGEMLTRFEDLKMMR